MLEQPTTAAIHGGQPKSGNVPIKISKEDFFNEIKYWESAVICYVIGANPPLQVIEGFVKRIWKNMSIDKVGLLAKGVFIVRMSSNSDRDLAYETSGILFDRKPFVVKPRTPKTSTSKTNLTSMPI